MWKDRVRNKSDCPRPTHLVKGKDGLYLVGLSPFVPIIHSPQEKEIPGTNCWWIRLCHRIKKNFVGLSHCLPLQRSVGVTDTPLRKESASPRKGVHPMVSKISLTSSARANLSSLQNTVDLLATTQSRLASGKRSTRRLTTLPPSLPAKAS